jgi:non-specific serine/threonine protein kinase
MNKAYSSKALPSGTVLREWRIDEVLGVGGFGIVYKAQGIYFNELVAIKEYFPSSISERESDDTVVPIDSDAEEVHALGLKKFVEEAKLLWNLSTPSRHPNIVSVRSLFEIHGTAYMVMDFEDGLSLSKMLKQGRRFNERSLWSILRPIAEGLERAHRVGVLHLDIKPPNILINEDNRPVLIDFGSARFEAAEATSTKVTFHTPPYAAIEQYVKTYAQGPWTDIYALGVVMYECVTGEKPPEVLERLHAGLGTPLAAGKWPGYSKKFLAAVDAAMVVKPEDRPQSLSEWLASFGMKAEDATDLVEDDEATRFYAGQVEAEEIVPVPPTPNADPKAPVDTGVPNDPREASFKRAGEETGTSKKRRSPKAAEPADEDPEKVPSRRRVVDVGAAAGADSAVEADKPEKQDKRPPEPANDRKKLNLALVAGIAVVVLAGAGTGALMLRGGSQPQAVAGPVMQTAPDNSAAAAASLDAQPAADANAAAATQNAAAPTAQQQPGDQGGTAALSSEKAKTAAAEAQLAALKKAAAKAAKAQELAAGPAASTRKDKKSAMASAASTSSAAETGTVSAAKLSQFYSIIDGALSMTKRVIRSGNGQNAALARTYDANLRTLRDSMRGIQSDKEADRLIKQASQTRAYVEFLAKQPQ